jgi:hypothetical protein
MYSNSNTSFVCIAYQSGTRRDARTETGIGVGENCGVGVGRLRTPRGDTRGSGPRGTEWLERQRADSSAVISLTADFASPKSIDVFGSKYSSFSMPAKPGFIERLITITD